VLLWKGHPLDRCRKCEVLHPAEGEGTTDKKGGAIQGKLQEVLSVENNIFFGGGRADSSFPSMRSDTDRCSTLDARRSDPSPPHPSPQGTAGGRGQARGVYPGPPGRGPALRQVHSRETGPRIIISPRDNPKGSLAAVLELMTLRLIFCRYHILTQRHSGLSRVAPLPACPGSTTRRPPG